MNIELDCPIHKLYVDPMIAHLPCLYCLCDNAKQIKHLTSRAKYFLKNPHKVDLPFTQFQFENDLRILKKWRSESFHDLRYFENFISRFIEQDFIVFSLDYSKSSNNFSVRLKTQGPSQYFQFDGLELYQPFDTKTDSPHPIYLHNQLKSPKEISSYYRSRLVNEALLIEPSTLSTLKILDPKLYKKYGLHLPIAVDDFDDNSCLDPELTKESLAIDHTTLPDNNESKSDLCQSSNKIEDIISIDEDDLIVDVNVHGSADSIPDDLCAESLDIFDFQNDLLATNTIAEQDFDIFSEFKHQEATPISLVSQSSRSRRLPFSTEIEEQNEILEGVENSPTETIFFDELNSLNEYPISIKPPRNVKKIFSNIEIDCAHHLLTHPFEELNPNLDTEIIINGEEKELVEQIDYDSPDIFIVDDFSTIENTNFHNKVESALTSPKDIPEEISFIPSKCHLHKEYLIPSVVEFLPCFFCMCEDLKVARNSLKKLSNKKLNVLVFARDFPQVDIKPNRKQKPIPFATSRLVNHFTMIKQSSIQSINKTLLKLFPSINFVDIFYNQTNACIAFNLRDPSNSLHKINYDLFFVSTEFEKARLVDFLIKTSFSYYNLNKQKEFFDPTATITKHEKLRRFAKSIQTLTSQLSIATDAKIAYDAKHPKKRSHSTTYKKKILKGLLPLNRKITFINKQIKGVVAENQALLPNVNLQKPNIKIVNDTIKYSNLLNETVEINLFDPKITAQ